MIEVVIADTSDLLDKTFALRQEVFVTEQEVSPEEEFDEFETTSRHFVALDESGIPCGAARWRITSKGVKLERFAVKKSFRGKGVGGLLVSKVLDDIRQELGEGQFLYLHAQLQAVPLYEKFGFVKSGDRFLECNILHYPMQLLF